MSNPFDSLNSVLVAADDLRQVLETLATNLDWIRRYEDRADASLRQKLERDREEHAATEARIAELAAQAKAEGRTFGSAGAPPSPARTGSRAVGAAPPYRKMGPLPLWEAWQSVQGESRKLVEGLPELVDTFEAACRSCPATELEDFAILETIRRGGNDDPAEVLSRSLTFVDSITGKVTAAKTRLISVRGDLSGLPVAPATEDRSEEAPVVFMQRAHEPSATDSMLALLPPALRNNPRLLRKRIDQFINSNPGTWGHPQSGYTKYLERWLAVDGAPNEQHERRAVREQIQAEFAISCRTYEALAEAVERGQDEIAEQDGVPPERTAGRVASCYLLLRGLNDADAPPPPSAHAMGKAEALASLEQLRRFALRRAEFLRLPPAKTPAPAVRADDVGDHRREMLTPGEQADALGIGTTPESKTRRLQIARDVRSFAELNNLPLYTEAAPTGTGTLADATDFARALAAFKKAHPDKLKLKAKAGAAPSMRAWECASCGGEFQSAERPSKCPKGCVGGSRTMVLKR